MAKDNSANSAPEQIYKTEQFEMFLKTLKQDSYAHWKEIAEVIGVDRDTISAWKKHPRAANIPILIFRANILGRKVSINSPVSPTA